MNTELLKNSQKDQLSTLNEIEKTIEIGFNKIRNSIKRFDLDIDMNFSFLDDLQYTEAPSQIHLDIRLKERGRKKTPEKIEAKVSDRRLGNQERRG